MWILGGFVLRFFQSYRIFAMLDKMYNHLKIFNMKIRVLLFGILASCVGTVAAEDVFVYLKSGNVNVYPAQIVKSVEQGSEAVSITLQNDSVVRHDMALVDSIGHTAPQQLPVFTSFKFNNKYNDQVFADVEAEVGTDTVRARVGAIGKWLTPSFQVSDDRAKVWVGTKEQTSKQSRVRFEGDVTYTLGYEGWYQLSYQKIKEEVWSEPGDGFVLEELELQPEQLSTNAPSNYDEDVDKLVDKNSGTYFHSTWGTGDYEKLPLYECPYIEVALDEEMKDFLFGYSTGYHTNKRMPQAFLLEVSSDGEDWMEVKEYTEEDGIPQEGVGMVYESPLIRLDAPCKYIRLTMTQSNYKNYLVLSEFWLKKLVSEGVSEPPTLISPAEYAYITRPYGRDVCVSVDWPSDTARVPAVYIYTENGEFPADKETYLKAAIRIDGAGVFPDFNDSVNIRGRGNSSWAGQYGKSPYRLKFDESKKPFGLTKGKSWVLLANRQTGSMLSNAVAMKIASMVETAGANKIIPVDLYLNDIYRGNYNFTQQVGLSNNSIDLDDETNAVLFELDSYFDEDYRFKSYYYNLPVNVKDPDMEDYADPDAQFSLIMEDFENFAAVLYYGGDEYANMVDVEMLARFLLVNELVMNLELGHPKSTFLYKEDLRALHSRYVFGPVWDFDWAYGYEYTKSYCECDPTLDYFDNLIMNAGYFFFRDLRYNSEAVKRAYYKEWKDFMENHYEELLDYVDTYYKYANSSFQSNADLWYDGGNYERVKENTVNWLRERAQYIYDNLETYDLDSPMAVSIGDANLDGYITVADVACIVNKIMGLPNETFDFDQADLDYNGKITVNDVVHAVALVMKQPQMGSNSLARPKAEATLRMEAFQVGLGEDTYCPLTLNVADNAYVALQFDLALPEGMTLQAVDLGTLLETHKAVFQEVGTGAYRVMVYSDNGALIPQGAHTIHLALNSVRMLPEAQRIVSTSAALMTHKMGEDERLASHSAHFDVAPTAIQGVEQTAVIRGGDALRIEVATARELSVFAPDGHCVKSLSLQPGTHTIALPQGVYIVDGTKVLIRN